MTTVTALLAVTAIGFSPVLHPEAPTAAPPPADAAPAGPTGVQAVRAFQLAVTNTSPPNGSYSQGSFVLLKDAGKDSPRRIAPGDLRMLDIGKGSTGPYPVDLVAAEYSDLWLRQEVSPGDPDAFAPDDYMPSFRLISGVTKSGENVLIVARLNARDYQVLHEGERFVARDLPIHPEGDPRLSTVSVTFNKSSSGGALLRSDLAIDYRQQS